MKRKAKVPCDKCNGKGFYYDYGHSGETEYYHECDKCNGTGYLFIPEEEEAEHFYSFMSKFVKHYKGGKNDSS